MARDTADRVFEGAQVLQGLLEESGTFADVDDVAEAFRLAVKDGAPPQAVIEALWAEEPRFTSPDDARRLFSNLLALHALIAAGQEVDLSLTAPPVKVTAKRQHAEKPAPFEEVPDEAFLEAAWRYLDDASKERDRLVHAFDNTQDALVGWLDTLGLSDDAFALACQVATDVFAALAVGGRKPGRVTEAALEAAAPDAAPAGLTSWVEQNLQDADLNEADAEALLSVLRQVTAALWAAKTR